MTQCLCFEKGWKVVSVTFKQESKLDSDMTALLSKTDKQINNIILALPLIFKKMNLCLHFIFHLHN